MYFVTDIEATCWEQHGVRDNNEIIEIGVVACSDDGESLDTFQSFVRPVFTPNLSVFCRKLTKIQQDWIDVAEPLKMVVPKISTWIKDNWSLDSTKCPWVTFGAWDESCLINDCHRHRVVPPFGRFIDLKEAYVNFSGCANCGLKEALEREKIPWEGVGHRALADATNASNLAKKIGLILE